MARFLSNSIRGSDFLCRYGGEEFAMILPNTDEQAALILAEKIHSGLKEHPIGDAILAGDDKVTITMGIATTPAEAQTMEDLINLADRRLYAGKEAGRNCIVASGKQQ
jgi:diguanylate cyclase (GGDEF)-like protein